MNYFSVINSNKPRVQATRMNPKIHGEAVRQKEHTVWFHLFKALENANYSDKKQISGYFEIGK